MIPKYIFIIPYRKREEHLFFFKKYMKYNLEDYKEHEYEIIFVHQKNNLSFNRGAMKNMGFIYVKEKYPEFYNSIILIFNDIDTVPYKKGLIDYNVEFGNINHYYGYTFALGGIFSIRAGDFEKLNGFPNYWGWGFEDNVLNKRAIEHKININRSNFYPIQSMQILHFFDNYKKKINTNILNKHTNKNYKEKDGLSFLKNYKYEIDKNNQMIHVLEFKTLYSSKFKFDYHNILNGHKIKVRQNKMKMKF